ncbi:MAG: hypothetical protein RBT74_07180 [Tenuifilaceae bacterium]|jgi:hypothetical protein|nr:hypothetical protein [Tenuifilaceae bacterium]
MYKSLLFSLVFSVYSFIVLAQTAENLKLTRSDLVGMEETRFSVYEENSLWGYINGGADIYLEYGFKELMAQNFVWESEPFKVDVYVMANPEAAFGIYSISKFSCKAEGKAGTYSCINPYQVQVAHGNLYVSVIAYNGTSRSMELATQIAKKIVAKHRAKPLLIPTIFESKSLAIDKSKIKLINGPLAIQNAYATLEKTFDGIDNYSIWIAPLADNADKVEVVYVIFQKSEQRELIEQRMIENNQIIIKSNGSKLVFFSGKNVEDYQPQLLEISKYLGQL